MTDEEVRAAALLAAATLITTDKSIHSPVQAERETVKLASRFADWVRTGKLND